MNFKNVDCKNLLAKQSLWFINLRLTNIIWDFNCSPVQKRNQMFIHNLIQTKILLPFTQNSLQMSISVHIVNERALRANKNVHSANSSWLLSNKVFYDFRAPHPNIWIDIFWGFECLRMRRPNLCSVKSIFCVFSSPGLSVIILISRK